MASGPELTTLLLSDGYRCAVRIWSGSNVQGRWVLIIHGIQSHGGWFEATGHHLAQAGLGVILPDRRGSGANSPGRGHVDTVRQLIEDLMVCLDHGRDRWGAAQAHVVGISWGGKLGVALARRAADRVASLTLVAPGIYAKADLPIRTKLAVAAACVYRPHKLFPIPLDDPGLFTANPDRIKFIAGDPLRLRRATASFLWVSKRLDFLARRPVPPQIPVHLMLAEHDDIVDNEQLRRWLRRQPAENRRMTLYHGAHHTLEFEPDASRYLHDLREWLLCQGAPPGQAGGGDGARLSQA